MIILEVESAIVRNLLERSLDTNETLSGEYCFCDFDGVSFKLKKEKDAAKWVLYMNLSCTKEINEHGGAEQYEQLYGSIKAEPPTGFTHAINIDLTAGDDKQKKDLITLAARLKSNMLGAPLIWVAQQIDSKSNWAAFEIPYRSASAESIYITPSEGGAAAIFNIRFNDPDDRIIGEVFFGELKAARTRVKSAPAVSFDSKPPKDLEAFNLRPELRDEKLFGFVTIGLGAPQLSERKRQDTAYYIPMFRNYLHYHIKCAKAFLHQKMRLRTALLLKELAAAKPEPKKKVRRTATGKIMA